MKTVQRIEYHPSDHRHMIMLTPLYHTGQAWSPMAAVQIQRCFREETLPLTEEIQSIGSKEPMSGRR